MSYKANSNIIKVSTTGVVGTNGLIVGNPDTTAKDASAALEIESTTGGLLLPRVTTVQRDAIASPTRGLLVENTTTDRAEVRAFSGWQRIMTEETAAITGSQIVNSAITTDKIVNNAVTYAKLQTPSYVVSSNSSNFTTGTGTTNEFSVTNLSVTIAAAGRPIYICLMSYNPGNLLSGSVSVSNSANQDIDARLYIKKNGSVFSDFYLRAAPDITLIYPCSSFNTIDLNPGIGNVTYNVTVQPIDTTTSVSVYYVSLIAFTL